MAQSPFTAQAAWPNTAKQERLSSKVGSDQYQVIVTLNTALNGLQRVLAALGGADVPMTTAVPTIGTTVTMATPAQFISINGVNGTVAAETAKAFGSLGTIPTATWGLIAIERIANATTTFVSAANNYSTGYASEALAIAAMPAQSADKVVTGYITILAASPGWVAGTDALAGGTGGTPATTTNYYGTPGAADTTSWSSCKQLSSSQGTVIIV